MKVFFTRKYRLLNYYTKASLLIALNVLYGTLIGFAQNQSYAKNSNESLISYEAMFDINGQQMILGDTILVRGSFVLEPIKIHETQDEISISSGKTENISKKHKLESYYFTDLDKRLGMIFKVNDEPNNKNIKTYTIENKNAGYGLNPEPFFFEKGYTIEDFSKVKDTVLNGRNCFIIMTNKIISTKINSVEDKLLFIKMVIDPSVVDQNYSFISSIIVKHFGGAIIRVESKYGSGLSTSLKFNYLSKFSPAYKLLFDKYEAVFKTKIALVDR